MIRYYIAILLNKAIKILYITVLIRCVFSWFPYKYRNNSFGKIVYSITEPFLAPIRKMLPQMGIDLSPIILFMIIRLIEYIIMSILYF
ncbi:MAG: YggT family protein [Fusobacteriaceae bacterium]|jgi:YggT family protein|nr:YggT family protein [Fusobacteriaceae bacterium]